MAPRPDKDLLPWILGGFLVIAGASAAVVSLTPSIRPVVAEIPPALASTVIATMPAVTVANPTSKPAGLPAGQVYQCTINGERTFSDSPCGDRTVVRRLSPVNTMTPIHVTINRAYLPVPPPDHETPPDEEASPTEQRNVYVTEDINILERRRREHRAHEQRHSKELRR